MSQRNGPVKSEVVRLMAGHTGYFDGMTTSTINSSQVPPAMHAPGGSSPMSAQTSELSQIPHQTLTFAEGSVIYKEKEKPKNSIHSTQR